MRERGNVLRTWTMEEWGIPPLSRHLWSCLRCCWSCWRYMGGTSSPVATNKTGSSWMCVQSFKGEYKVRKCFQRGGRWYNVCCGWTVMLRRNLNRDYNSFWSPYVNVGESTAHCLWLFPSLCSDFTPPSSSPRINQCGAISHSRHPSVCLTALTPYGRHCHQCVARLSSAAIDTLWWSRVAQ